MENNTSGVNAPSSPQEQQENTDGNQDVKDYIPVNNEGNSKIVNSNEQNNAVNPQDNYYENEPEENGSDELPEPDKQGDDSEEIKKKIPKMDSE